MFMPNVILPVYCSLSLYGLIQDKSCPFITKQWHCNIGLDGEKNTVLLALNVISIVMAFYCSCSYDATTEQYLPEYRSTLITRRQYTMKQLA